ncbi:methyl-accepting chemotaxis protein [Asticcacaulis sp. SL142]|uniref:methyl-accepting chemotaxis protein n=1 Tax=Asticcacaulis sp. SL142 TaxID=2995155 RepID=UPI002D1E4530|nr:methyl-accepting chemotaxis protein [Asticcacaulis sp. SL142]
MTLWQNATMEKAQKSYEHIVDHLDVALLSGARMRQNLYALQGATYGLAFSNCPSATCDNFSKLGQTSVQRFGERYQGVIDAVPEYETDFGPLKARFDKIADTAINKAIPAGLNNEQDALRALLLEQDTSIESLSTDIGAKVDEKQKLHSGIAEKLKADINVQARNSLIISVLVTAAITALAALLAFGDIAKMLGRLTSQMQAIANGRLDQVIDGQSRGDEIGIMAKTLGVFKDGLAEAERLRHETAEQREQAEAQRKAAMLNLADQFERSVGGIVTLVSSAATEMQAAAAQLTSTAQETSAQSIAVSAAAEEAGTNVTSVAGSAEELGASVSEIGRQVQTSAHISATAVTEARQAMQVVEELNEVAGSINGVVDMISGLASQTNLLALNATIESARAGEAGKGFAVVASEVKQLAGQTAKATTEISAKIEQIQEATTRAVSVIQNITATIQEINNASTVIASAVEQQNAATQEIVQAVNQASMGTTEVTSNITGVAQAAEQTGAAASQVLSSSGELAEQAEKLRTEMDSFLATVRAA